VLAKHEATALSHRQVSLLHQLCSLPEGKKHSALQWLFQLASVMGCPWSTPDAWSSPGEAHKESCYGALPLQPAHIPCNTSYVHPTGRQAGFIPEGDALPAVGLGGRGEQSWFPTFMGPPTQPYSLQTMSPSVTSK